MTTDNEFDGLLHDALSEYRQAEPLAGMEERVLRRLAAQSSQRRHGWLKWSLVAACSAGLVVAVWIASRPGRPMVDRAQQASGEPRVAAETPVAGAKAKQSVRPATARSGSATVDEGAPQISASAAMSAQFPTPTPLTAEERLFMAALQRTPDSMSVAGEQDEAITIAEIKIEPLAIGGIPSSTNLSSGNPGEKQ
jgi:hypothetical protein